jgi:hypothetical protein
MSKESEEFEKGLTRLAKSGITALQLYRNTMKLDEELGHQSKMERMMSDISVADNGDIRYMGAGGRYRVQDLHRLLTFLSARGEPTEHHRLSIASKVPSEIVTDFVFELQEPYNIDDELAGYLYGGSIMQGKFPMRTHYTGLLLRMLYTYGVPLPEEFDPEKTQFQVVIDNEIRTLLGNGDPDSLMPDTIARTLIRTPGHGKRIRIQKHHSDKPYDCYELLIHPAENWAFLSYHPPGDYRWERL